jgi:hypothetical protein
MPAVPKFSVCDPKAANNIDPGTYHGFAATSANTDTVYVSPAFSVQTN